MTSAERHRDTHEVHRPHWAHPVDLAGSQEPRFGGHLLWSVASDSGQGGRPLRVGGARGPGLAPRPKLRLPSLVAVPPKAHGQPGCEGPSRSARAPFPGEQGVYLRRGSAGGRRRPGEVSGVSLKPSVVQGPRRLLRVLFSGGVSGARWGCLPAPCSLLSEGPVQGRLLGKCGLNGQEETLHVKTVTSRIHKARTGAGLCSHIRMGCSQ